MSAPPWEGDALTIVVWPLKLTRRWLLLVKVTSAPCC
jgi:hypothetical protein